MQPEVPLLGTDDVVEHFHGITFREKPLNNVGMALWFRKTRPTLPLAWTRTRSGQFGWLVEGQGHRSAQLRAEMRQFVPHSYLNLA